MLNNLIDLGTDLKNQFQEVSHWPELSFDHKDKMELSKLRNVSLVNDHSLQLKIENNHVILPSQYILYAALCHELAFALRDQLDFFELYKEDKGVEKLASELTTGTYQLDGYELDDYSKSVAFLPFVDGKHRFEAKSIVNGEKGNYKIRSASDFFSSVLLKIINVPDASSGILGKFIYELSGDKNTYNYFVNKFSAKLPFLLKNDVTNRFARDVFRYLYKYDGLSRIKEVIVQNSDIKFKSIKFEEVSLTSIFRVSNVVLSAGDLMMGSKPRFFENPLFIDGSGNYVYFTTEWTSGTDSRLDLDSLCKMLIKYYPEFSIIKHNESYELQFTSMLRGENVGDLSGISEKLNSDLRSAGLVYDMFMFKRFMASLLSKRFLILTGLSGSGKTKLAQAFAMWMCASKDQYKLVPVGADWTNREPLLGYRNALDDARYVKPETGVLQLLLRAKDHPEEPHFLILDEMNLSHVERYFADFLSAMESGDGILLHSSEADIDGVPPKLKIPDNLFIIGTVNIDETTYMFSPKVLDRANVIEFRVEKAEMEEYFKSEMKVDLDAIAGEGRSMATDFLARANDKSASLPKDEAEEMNHRLLAFFTELKKVGAEFGYRSAGDIHRLTAHLKAKDPSMDLDTIIDIAVMQKLLPKLHGSRRKLSGVLTTLADQCAKGSESKTVKQALDEPDYEKAVSGLSIHHPLSFGKNWRMYRNAIDNGYASYAEA